MNAFDMAWTLLKEDSEECPTCGMKKSQCMTHKMGCGGEKEKKVKKGYVMRKAAFRLKYDYNTLRKQYEDLYDEGPMGNDPGDGIIYDDHKPRNEREQRILHHYMNKVGLTPGLSAMEMGMDDDMHQMANDVAQEYFVEHIRDMNAMNTGISGRDSAPSRVGVSPPQIPEQRNQ